MGKLLRSSRSSTRRRFVPRPFAPSGGSKPLALYSLSDGWAQNVPADVSNFGIIVVNGYEKARLANWRAQNSDMVCLAYLNMGFTKETEYQDDYGPNNPMVQPYSWTLYPTTGVSYGQAHETPREDWFIHKFGTSATAANRFNSVAFPTAWLMNVGNVDYQNTWAANAISFCQQWGFDGVMADDCLADLAAHTALTANCTLEWPGRTDCQPAVQSFLANVGPQLRAAGLHLVPNLSDAWRIGDSVMQAQWCNNVAGFMFEHFTYTYDTTTYLAGDVNPTYFQYVRNCHAGGAYAFGVGYHPIADLKAMRVGRAAMECVRDASKRTAFAYMPVINSGGYTEQNVNPANNAWTVTLGAAVAAEQTVGSNGNQVARTRRLTNGFVAINPSTGVAQTITCPVAGTRMSTGAAIAANATFVLQPDDAEIVYF